MADALCGPSNALQNFQKHSQVDRTLQQDRLVSRQQGSSQGFRSNQPNAGILDPEFEAFQAGQIATPPPQFDARPFSAPHAPQFLPQQQRSPLPDWASDFQRLHISPASPAGPSHQSTVQPIQQAPRHSPQASWHQDFMQSQQMNTFQQPQSMFQPSYQDVSWEYSQQAQFPSTVSQGKQPMMEQQDTQWDSQAFEAAFDAATQDALAEDTLATDDAMAREIEEDVAEIEYLISKKERELTRERNQGLQSNHLIDLDMQQGLDREAEWPDELHADYTHPEEQVMHEPVHDHPQETEAHQQDANTPPLVDEELARTAGQLLDSVSHETSQKFQESVFLQLMRRLRDKEVTVEGENFVETGTSAATSPAAGLQPTMTTIPIEEQDTDLGRFGNDEDASEESNKEPDDLPATSRPLTPDIDPPAPEFDVWRERLYSTMDILG